MAEIIGVVSGVLGLAQLAFQSSLVLYEKVESFKDAPYKVRDLRDELKCLVDVLETLSQTAQDSEIKLDSLELPLRICNEACKGFSEFIDSNTTRSTSGKFSKLDWLKLQYKGDDITEFKEKLAIHKLTITIALEHANL